ncbi:hypothetical protein [Pseudonocardia sp. GCM10023141]|uniref:hypothetical protein n=1 Tax=Pseudonocardia sp. GCM10023141 TaxID=3252653 RepID=UPI0036202926
MGALLVRRPTLDAIACLTGRRTLAVHAALAVPDDVGFLTLDDFAWAPLSASRSSPNRRTGWDDEQPNSSSRAPAGRRS